MDSEATDPDLDPEEAETHRAFVREVHRGLASVYAWGGALVVLAVSALIGMGWYRGMLWSPLLWIGAIVTGLLGMLVVRWLVYRRADDLWERVEGYCEANGVDAETLRAHFGDDPMYQFFDALFELRERRRKFDEESGELEQSQSSESTG